MNTICQTLIHSTQLIDELNRNQNFNKDIFIKEISTYLEQRENAFFPTLKFTLFGINIDREHDLFNRQADIPKLKKLAAENNLIELRATINNCLKKYSCTSTFGKILSIAKSQLDYTLKPKQDMTVVELEVMSKQSN
jgi:hypothetical protein